MADRSLEAVDRVLIDGLRPALKDALAKQLAAGEPPQQILARVRRVTGGPRALRGGLTYLAVVAFLVQRTGVPAEELDPESFGERS